MLEEDIPNQILITGYRGVGKTFLLKKILQDQDEKFLTAYIDLSSIYARQRTDLTEEEVMKEILFSIKNAIQYNVSYIFTGSVSKTSEIISMLNGQTGAFGGRMIQINVEPFTREETKRYVDERSNNIKFNEEGFNQFYECTRGIPIYINSLCSILPGNQVCDEKIILENIKLNIDQIAIMWIYVWGRLNIQEREIIIAILENDGTNWSSLLDELDYSKPTISKYLDSLSNKGIIEYDFNKKYIISDKMLKTWLKTKYEQNGRYPL